MTIWQRLGRDNLYLLLGFPLALTAFVVMVTLLSLSAGLLVTVVGIFVAVATLYVGKGFAALERVRIDALGGAPVLRPRYRHGRALTVLRDGQAWRDALHALVAFPVAVVTWSLTITWWAAALGGLTYPIWYRWLPRDNPPVEDNWTLAELLGFQSVAADVLLNLAIGVAFAATLPYVLHGMAVAQAGIGRVLLGRHGALRDQVAALETSRAAAVSAERQALTRLERDLHDGPQQRLVRLAMDLSAAERRIDTDPEGARTLVAGALEQARETLDELHALGRGIAPSVLVDRGLPAALSALAARSTVPVALDVDLGGRDRLPEASEHAAYYVVSEALANVAKHSGATHGSVAVRARDGWLDVVVIDDGRGGAHPAKGHGLAGLADRVAAVDGQLAVDSPEGGPTVVTALVPCG